MMKKRLLSLIMVLCMIVSVFAVPAVSAAQVETAQISAKTEIAQTGANYGLAKNIQDGNILHCFNWKYNDIKAELKNIAEAGFTSVQTSPAQPGGSGAWYWLYQPYGFYVGTNPLGSKADLQSLCQEADKYGIKVVVDVVANHLNGDTGRVQSDLQDGQYWHNYGSVSNWADRYQVVNGEIGMRDLNSEHSYVQKVVANYINELKGIGVDGIRWDAAKHIALPSENCNFWPAVTSQGLYHYGEILVGPDDRGSGNEHLMKEYTNYMTVTDSSYGADLRNAFAGGGVPSSYGNWSNRGIAANKLIYWGESHDTWSNGHDWGFSNGMSQNVIDRAYAVAASRNGTNALYFSRPGSADKDSIHSGQKGSTSFKNAEVAAVNQLKNACVGEKDYYTTANNCAVVCRESGAVIVAGSGGNFSVNVPNGGGTTKPGTYKDLVSGSTWTVTSSNISGQIGSSGIAVLLNATVKPAGPSATVTPGSQTYKTDSLALTLNYSDATSGQYSIDGGAYQSFSNGQKITIGAGLAYGTKTTVSVKASNGSTTSDAETYTYTKADPTATGIYFDNSQKNWNEVYCYIYKDGNNAPAQWPGTKMTKESGNIWSFEPPSGYDNCFVLFTDNNGNQVPGANESGLEYNGSPKIYKNGSWEDYAPVPPVTRPTQPVTVPTTKTEPTEEDTIAPPTVVPGPDSFIVLGDVDGNEIVNIKDATLVQKYIAGLIIMNKTEKNAGDVDRDGDVTIKDATLLQKYVAETLSETLIGTKIYGNGGGYSDPVIPTEPDPTEATEPDFDNSNTIDLTKLGGKVVALKNNGFSTPYAYAWKSSGETVMSWPGEAMKKLNSTYYYAVVPEGCDKIIFSNNGGNQSSDLSIPSDYAIFNGANGQWEDTLSDVADVRKFPINSTGNSNNNNNNTNRDGYIYVKDNANWGNVYCHSWGSDGSGTSWPGTQMESFGNGIYGIKLPSGHTGVVFNNGSGTQTSDLSVEMGKAYNNQSNQWEPCN